MSRPFALVALLALGACHGREPLDGLAYPGGRLLVDRRVDGRSMDFHWRCWATTDALERVVARYDADPALARAAFRMAEGEVGFAARADPDLHVAVFPAASLALHRQCEGPAAEGDVTVIQATAGRAARP
jgi:hypothetical protein